MPFILGFILLLAGFAMVVVGPIPFTKTWTLSAWKSRMAGLIFMSFIPLFFGLRYFIKENEWDQELGETGLELIKWGILVFCFLTGGFLIFYLGRPAKVKRTRRPAAVSSNSAEEPAESTSADNPMPFDEMPTPKKRSSKRGKDPFDFS